MPEFISAELAIASAFIADYFPAFLVGLLGSGHCLVMCGGMASALQMMMPAQQQRPWSLPLWLSIGRIASYSALGAMAGFFGFALVGAGGPAPYLLQLFAGVMLLLMALYVSKIWTGLTRLEALGSGLWRRLQPFSRRLLPLDSPIKAFAYGWCWGYLPCGLIYSSLSWSLASGSAVEGAWWMAAFGAGTLPALLLAGQAAATFSRLKNQLWLRYGAAMILSLYGLQTIYLALRRLVF